jgi:uncharacterized damage-inducible protein DinB
MMHLIDHYRAMARNNAWSNRRLYRACCCLSEEEFRKDRTSAFPSLQLTLNHIYIIDRFYLSGLERKRPSYAMLNERVPFPHVDGLSSAQRELDDRLINFCDTLGCEDLMAEVAFERGSEGAFAETVPAVLSHLFIHQIHHRGQVSAMLAGSSIKAPQLDEFFLLSDAAARAADPPEIRAYATSGTAPSGSK